MTLNPLEVSVVLSVVLMSKYKGEGASVPLAPKLNAPPLTTPYC